jgi:hypothetical protein
MHAFVSKGTCRCIIVINEDYIYIYSVAYFESVTVVQTWTFAQLVHQHWNRLLDSLPT